MGRTTKTGGAAAWCAAGAVLLAPPAAPQAAPPLLRPQAFATPSRCAVDPFADPTAEQRERALESDCGRDDVSLALRTPRAAPTDTGPSRVEFEFDQLVTRRLLGGLTTSARMGYAAAGDPLEGLRTQRLLFAAGTRWRLGEEAALELQVGRDAGPAQRSRALLGGQWQALASHAWFAQWAIDDAEQRSTLLGWRWALEPRSAWFELRVRRDGEGRPMEPQLGLRVTGVLR